MKLPSRPALLSTTYHKADKQHSVVIEEIKPIARLWLIISEKISKDELNKIEFYIEDKTKRIFNKTTLDTLIKEKEDKSQEFCTELQKGIEAQPPLKFVFKSEKTDLSKLNFKISWLNK